MASGGMLTRQLELARALVAAVRAVPGVSDVTAGQVGEVATYGPGEKVSGALVALTGEGVMVEVHICAQYADTLVLPELADRVRRAVRDIITSAGVGHVIRVDVAIDDLREAHQASQ